MALLASDARETERVELNLFNTIRTDIEPTIFPELLMFSTSAFLSNMIASQLAGTSLYEPIWFPDGDRVTNETVDTTLGKNWT